MLSITFAEFRNHARAYFDAVESGETIEVRRHGKPVARLVPVPPSPDRWKRAEPLRIPHVVLSKVILSERKERTWREGQP